MMQRTLSLATFIEVMTQRVRQREMAWEHSGLIPMSTLTQSLFALAISSAVLKVTYFGNQPCSNKMR